MVGRAAPDTVDIDVVPNLPKKRRYAQSKQHIRTMCLVPGQPFVASETIQVHPAAVLSRHCAEVLPWGQIGGIGQILVALNTLDERLRCDVVNVHGVSREAPHPGGLAHIRALIGVRMGKSERIGGQLSIRDRAFPDQLSGHAQYGAGVQAAAQEQGDRRLAPQATADGFLEDVEKMLGVFVVRSVANGIAGIELEIPRDVKPAVPQHQAMGRRQSQDVLVEGFFQARNVIAEIFPQHAGVEPALKSGHLEQRAQLGTEGECAAVEVVVERPDAQQITRAEQFSVSPVPDCEGEIADDALRAILVPTLVGSQYEFGIGVGAGRVAFALEGGAQFASIVHPPIKGEAKGATFK